MSDFFEQLSEEELDAAIESEKEAYEEIYEYFYVNFRQYEKYQLTYSNKKNVIDSISSCHAVNNTRLIGLIDYIMQSSVEDIYIIQSECLNDKKIVLMIIPALKIGFDLRNRRKKQFFEHGFKFHKPADIYDAIMEGLVTTEFRNEIESISIGFPLNRHKPDRWNFYAIDDVIKNDDDHNFISLDVIKKIGKLNLDKGEDFPQKKNDQIASSPIATFLLNSMFKGESNWACGQSYYDVVENLKQSRIEEDVLCYEGLGDFKLEGCKLIENRPLRDEIFDKYSFDRIIVIFSLLDSPNEGIRFLGKYKIDKEESVRNKHLSFELCETRLELE